MNEMKDKYKYIDDKLAEELAEKYGTPLQVYDEDLIRKNTRNFFKKMRNNLKNFQQFYAVKALPNPAILKILLDEGCYMDCSSTSELYIAKKLGVKGENIMFTSNYTSKKDLKIALNQGVIINLDDVSLIDDLYNIEDRFPELISFRLNPGEGHTDSKTRSNILGGPEAKFGIPPDQIMMAYRKSKMYGAKKFGIHMMTGSCIMDENYYYQTVMIIIDTMLKISEELDIHFDFINLGGGLGIPYRPEEENINLDNISKMLNNLLINKLKNTKYSNGNLKIYMENGRYMTGPYGWLISRCHVIKNTYEKYYGLDACMSNLMRPGMYGSYHHITICNKDIRRDKLSFANVVGTLCENNDWFAKSRKLPDAKVGDLFIIHDTGAHSHSMGFQYNGKLRSKEILLYNDKKNNVIIREGEKIEDLYKNTIIPHHLRME